MMQQFLRAFAALAMASVLFGQTTNVKQPKLKSQKEGDAYNAIVQATDDDARIAAIDALLTKFADTELKAYVLYIATETFQRKGDFEKTVIYGERALEADPKMYGAMLVLAWGYATKTKEFDFDKEEKLGKAEKYVNEALALLKTAPKSNAQMTDEQWEAARKDYVAQGHQTLGQIAMTRKKYDVATASFKEALAAQPKPDSTTMLRLAISLNAQNKWEEALQLVDKIKDDPEAVPIVKQEAAKERVKALMAQKKAATPPAPPAPKP